MKRFLAIAIAAGTALMLSGSAFAAGTINDYGPGTYANGIAWSRHNLGNMGNYITVSPGVPGEIDAKGQGGGASEIC
ncbi:MAG: hypothetical protein HZB21_05065, partial [Deltaproteobacteria bacterium]|nr:hypothetical protein [Deltaproteobacteria bacterium]